MLLPRIVAAALAARQLGSLLPSDYCQPQCPSCRTDVGNFNSSTSCVADSPFITNCGSCQQCIITYSIDHEVTNLEGLEQGTTSILNLCANSNISSQVSALQSQASRLSLLGALVTISATRSSTAVPSITPTPTATIGSSSVSAASDVAAGVTSSASSQILASITAAPSSSTTPAPQSGSGTGPTLSQTWVAGPVVGSILGIATVFVVIYCTKRKHRKEEWELGAGLPAKEFLKEEDEESTDSQGKPQLHSECIPRKEMDNTEVIPPVELPALEPVGMELLTPRDETNKAEKDWPLPISPLPALFAMTEIRDERIGTDESPKHETFYHP